jgi:hypothetical protein
MPRPATALLRVALPCPELVDASVASQACVHAGSRCGYSVAARTETSIVLLPSVRPAARVAKCILPGLSSPAPASGQGGQGIAVELVEETDGLRISIEAPQGRRGEAYVDALRARLLDISSQRTPGLAAGHIAPQFPCEESAYLYVSSLLSDQTQTTGRAATEFLRDFSGRYSDASAPCDHSDPRLGPVADCSRAVERLCRVVGDVLTHPVPAPAACAELDAAAPWLRGAVERWVFSRVGPMLWRLFESQNGAEDRLFAQKSRALAAVSNERLFESLEVSGAFRGAADGKDRKGAAPKEGAEDIEDGVSEYGATSSESTCSTAATCADAEASRGVAADKVRKEASLRDPAADAEGGSCCSTPYERVASALREVEDSLSAGCKSTPRAAVDALAELQRDMKECAFLASGEHLSAMDDIMPVFIFVLLRSSTSSPVSCAKLLWQALTVDEQLGSEGRAVLLLECAGRYVASHWDVQELTAN